MTDREVLLCNLVGHCKGFSFHSDMRSYCRVLSRGEIYNLYFNRIICSMEDKVPESTGRSIYLEGIPEERREARKIVVNSRSGKK